MKKSKLVVTFTTSALMAADLATAGGEPGVIGGSPIALPAAALAAMSKSDMGKILASIAPIAAAEPRMGAMCYKVIIEPIRVEYVCPACGERTIHEAGDAWSRSYDLDRWRRFLKDLSESVGLKLDESEFCRKCSPDTKTPRIILTVRLSAVSFRRVCDVTNADRELLEAYFKESEAGREQQRNRTDATRLKELLGL